MFSHCLEAILVHAIKGHIWSDIVLRLLLLLNLQDFSGDDITATCVLCFSNLLDSTLNESL